MLFDCDVAGDAFLGKRGLDMRVNFMPQHLDALVIGEDRVLAFIDGDEDDQPRHHAPCLQDDIEMPQRDGIERTRVYAALWFRVVHDAPLVFS